MTQLEYERLLKMKESYYERVVKPRRINKETSEKDKIFLETFNDGKLHNFGEFFTFGALSLEELKWLKKNNKLDLIRQNPLPACIKLKFTKKEE